MKKPGPRILTHIFFLGPTSLPLLLGTGLFLGLNDYKQLLWGHVCAQLCFPVGLFPWDCFPEEGFLSSPAVFPLLIAPQDPVFPQPQGGTAADKSHLALPEENDRPDPSCKS